MISLVDALHLDLDGALVGSSIVPQTIDVTEWGPKLRFSAPPRLIEQFYGEIQGRLRKFVLYGSGDFHHLSALWLRQFTEPLTLISFDNHPDWAVTPPKWACGAWLNRALELPQVRKISVWGCGNFECWWPHQIFGNRRAERHGRLGVHPWADERSAADQNRRGAILRENWQQRFKEFASKLRGTDVYVTIDLDCLLPNEAVTNWENGRFTTADLVWAVDQLREHCRISGGDVCGAFSEPRYARTKQRLAAEFDRPKLDRPPAAEIKSINFHTLATIWPVLLG